MKRLIFWIWILGLFMLLQSSCSKKPKTVNVNLESKSGSAVTGKVEFVEMDSKVKMHATIKNASPGYHAIHIHEHGDCSASDGKSAGGHWNPGNTAHGKWGEGEHHAGDIGNILVGEDGKGTLDLETDKWCLGCGDPLKNILGKAIVVHDGPDDFVSQPSGNAGNRVACGEIE